MFQQHIRHVWLRHGLYFGGKTKGARYTAKQTKTKGTITLFIDIYHTQIWPK